LSRIRARSDWYFSPTLEPQCVSRISRPYSVGIAHDRDSGKRDRRPSQQHRQRTQVVDVTAQIRIEMHLGHCPKSILLIFFGNYLR
jgi:hypothetical protein